MTDQARGTQARKADRQISAGIGRTQSGSSGTRHFGKQRVGQSTELSDVTSDQGEDFRSGEEAMGKNQGRREEACGLKSRADVHGRRSTQQDEA